MTSMPNGARTKLSPTPCVVHLVRATNGIDPLATFLDSYRSHPAGIDHELVIVFKGFKRESDADPYLALAGAAMSEALFIGDEGFDLTAYFVAADRLHRERYCFLNSYSEILADRWLAVMDAALDEPGVGLVGATGSYASVRSYLLFHLGLGGAYARIFDDRTRTRALMKQLGARRRAAQGSPPTWLAAKLATAAEMRDQALWFEPFPNHHVRTNAFMLSSEVRARMSVRPLHRKVDAYQLESGRTSMTRQVERIGLRPVLVSRDGMVHEVAAWAESSLFWQGRQESLLIADNQTRDYQLGDAELRLLLSRYAWGDRAMPL